ncbi:hypothetical protein SUGI_1008000 [Cryptomeria japonica]|nr:hypothetical protein SUGI_1008000 [Cryptomeria japonica]
MVITCRLENLSHSFGVECERVVKVKKGDALAVPMGVVSWWFNKNSLEQLEILFLGDTSKAHHSGEFLHFNLTGGNGMLRGFSKQFGCRAWDLKADSLHHLLYSQSGSAVVKWNKGTPMPAPEGAKGDKPRLVYNCEESELDFYINKGGRMVILTSTYLQILEELGLATDLVKLDPRVLYSPGFSSHSAFQVTYITQGSGRVEVDAIFFPPLN